MKETEYEKSMRLWKIKCKKILKQEKQEREELRNLDSITFFYLVAKYLKSEKNRRVLPKRINKTQYYKKIERTIWKWYEGMSMSEIGRKYKLSKSRVQQIIYRFWRYAKKGERG